MAVPLVRVRAGAEVHRFPSACYFGKPFFMAKSIKVNQKRRGRPATGRDPVSAVRLPVGLTIKTTTRPVSTPGLRLRAQELATKAIEKMIDPSAPPEERAERRRRLTKGPIEFREYRVDLPKAARPD